jgi:uncharacterized protein YgbK (DUF1537 family)
LNVGLIADDLTGACDSAVPFLAGGRAEVGIWPNIPGGELACAAVSTESREEAPTLAFERTRQAAAELRSRGFRLIYCKVDSRLRGNLAADIEGVLADWGGTCLLAPALPAEGRFTRQGRQEWGSESTAIAPLLEGIGDRVSIRDAESDEDLAAQMPAALGLTGRPRPPLPTCLRPLVLVGSEAAFGQAAYAAARGWTVERRVRGDVFDLDGHDSLFLSGGGTAAGVLRQLGADGLELVGEAAPRVPVGLVRGGYRPGLPVVLKSGSFGDERIIDLALARLAGGG